MARVHKVEAWADGDELCVDQVNRELDALVGEMNGHVDVDNLPSANLITGAKVALDAFHNILWQTDPGPDIVAFEGGDTQGWEVLETGTLQTEDGYLELEGQATYDFATTEGTHAEVGVRVNGSVVCRSGSSGWFESDALAAFGIAPVGPGTQTVELVFRVQPGDYETTPSARDCTVNARCLWAREIGR